MLCYAMGAIGPYILSLRDLFNPYSAEFHPKRTKLKGYQKCKKKRR
jgi:hypothetical protein